LEKIPPSSFFNASTRTYSVILGSLAGLAAMAHGVFELLQGNASDYDILARIGAYSILPTYLSAGIATVILSLTVLFWTVGRLHKKNGAMIYFWLILLLFLVGGGIAPIAGLLIAWAAATRIRSPLSWWSKVLAQKFRRWCVSGWKSILITGFALLLIGIGIWLFFTPPGEIYQINWVDYVCWAFLGTGALLQFATILAGFARDLEKRGLCFRQMNVPGKNR